MTKHAKGYGKECTLGTIMWGTWGGAQGDNECNVTITMKYAHYVIKRKQYDNKGYLTYAIKNTHNKV